MRHNNAGRKLGRNPSHRKALLRNMAKALIINCRITTTEAKAKTLRGVVEPLVSLALKNDVHARREAYRTLGDHHLVKRLFDDIGPLFKDGGGGYTRVVKLALPRKGDAAPLAIIEFTKQPEKSVAAEAEKGKGAVKAEKAPKAAKAPKTEKAPRAAKPKAEKTVKAVKTATKMPKAAVKTKMGGE